MRNKYFKEQSSEIRRGDRMSAIPRIRARTGQGEDNKWYFEISMWNFEGTQMIGEPIGTFYMWEWAGYNNSGVSQFYVRDAVTGERTGDLTTSPQESDRTNVGSAQPKLTYGWNNTLKYK